MNSTYCEHCNGIFVNNYLLTGNKVQLYFIEMNSTYCEHCNGIFVNNNLLTGNKVQLCFIAMNSTYCEHCNGIFVNNYLLTGNKVQLYFIEMNFRYYIFRAKWENNNWWVHRSEIKTLFQLIPNFIFILSHFLFLKLSSFKISPTRCLAIRLV